MDAVEWVPIGQTVRRALMSLCREHRDVLVEVYCHGRSPQEVAKDLGISLGTVKSRTQDALRALRQAISQ